MLINVQTNKDIRSEILICKVYFLILDEGSYVLFAWILYKIIISTLPFYLQKPEHGTFLFTNNSTLQGWVSETRIVIFHRFFQHVRIFRNSDVNGQKRPFWRILFKFRQSYKIVACLGFTIQIVKIVVSIVLNEIL